MKTMTPQEALSALIEGNQRYLKDKSTLIDAICARSKEGLETPNPIACLLTCSDSRIPPQIFFDRALGDLFIIRVAGGSLDELVLSTIAFGVFDLKTPLILVMGHTRCGAIKAAIDGDQRPHIQPLIKLMAPAMERAKTRTGDLWLNVAEENALEIASRLKSPEQSFAPLIQEGKLAVRSALYHLETGEVTLLD